MEDSWIIKYERNVCMYELYMNTSIVFISWKVESRVKEANTINNIDNNVIKKDIDNDILNTVNPFWNTINDINNIYWYRFIENIINCRRTFLDKVIIMCTYFYRYFSFFFLDLIYINDRWRYMKIVMRYLFFLSYSKNSKNFAYYDRKKI